MLAKIRLLFIALCLLSSQTIANDTQLSNYQTDISLVSQKLLFENDSDLRKLAAKIVLHENISNHQVLDIIALKMVKGSNPDNDDLLAWYAKSLATAKSNRYVDFLTKQKSKKITKSSKVRKYIKKTLRTYEKKELISAEAFSINNYNLANLQSSSTKHYQAAITNRNTSESSYNFNNFDNSTTIEQVFNKLGLPDRTSVENEVTGPGGWKFTSQRIVMTYDKLGKVRFNEVDGIYKIERTVLTKGNTALTNSINNPQAKGYADTILNGTFQEYKATAKQIYHDSLYDEALLDVIATRIAMDKHLTHGHEVDAVAWLLKCLGKAANPRYKDFLTKIEETAETRKARRYADSALDQLPDVTGVEQFSSEN